VNSKSKIQKQDMKAKLQTFLTLAMLLGSVFLAGCGISEIDCAGLSHWSATDPPINQQHVFCGEWNKRKNRPAGFHSRPAGKDPATVGGLKITQPPNSQGIYGIRWSYSGHSNSEKFSSMFPDNCNRDQILKSIVYAVNHPKTCPDGAPRWARCGPNKPIQGDREYCEASDDSIFTIAFATLKNS
jgi:Bacterial EndoU nuclease